MYCQLPRKVANQHGFPGVGFSSTTSRRERADDLLNGFYEMVEFMVFTFSSGSSGYLKLWGRNRKMNGRTNI